MLDAVLATVNCSCVSDVQTGVTNADRKAQRPQFTIDGSVTHSITS